MATSLYKLEASFRQRFLGKGLKDRNGRNNEVEVFVDTPDIQYGERKFPSISIMMINMELDATMLDTSEDYEVSVDTTTSPIVRTTRRIPEYYMIQYEVSCYSLSAFEDRELLRWCESRYAPRDVILVDGEGYHVFRETFFTQDETDFDTIIYKKTWTYSILADIEDTDNDAVTKGIDEIRIKSNAVDLDSKTNADKANKTLHRVVVFDDQKYWFNPKE